MTTEPTTQAVFETTWNLEGFVYTETSIIPAQNEREGLEFIKRGLGGKKYEVLVSAIYIGQK
jgi:hypothetical protein